MTFYAGCAIWAYDGWANNFFPPGLAKDERLRAYARRLTAVEGNTTFYAVPPLPTAQKWAAETPESFQFCPKFPKAISHTAALRDVGAQTASFVGIMRALGPRLGPIMLQLPPGFGPNRLPLLRSFLENVPGGVRVAVEVRHEDWFSPENTARLHDTLREVGASRVAFDSRPTFASAAPDAIKAQEKKPNVPLVAEALQADVLVRYISSPVLPENEPYLNEWADRIAGWLREDRNVYFFAHCPVEELSPGIARDLYHRVAARVSLPPLPWDEIDQSAPPEDLSQLTLF